MPRAEEIPFGLAEIPTLQEILLRGCKPYVITSARAILEERDNLGYEGLPSFFYNDQEEERKDYYNNELEGLQVGYYNNEQECWVRIEINENS
ncbi:hypothetical protein BUALT_Bualt07G0113500 [Buddleja alternifolia]|uniref:Uncharacterized protein n=1 Tax=Buddleja alternifolia TaxID=168488 RepID=A0AAV6XKQ0_9LAMI|nr:hypothetical protein BUALT_Bualt07G0113500 [Buddleja alternifolia]